VTAVGHDWAAPALQTAPLRFVPSRRFWAARPISATLILTRDELLVVRGPADEAGEILLRQGRDNLAMARRPIGWGGEQVELAALDGQEATLRFDRRHAPAAAAIASWLAGLPI
jgi:hypothetical protein